MKDFHYGIHYWKKHDIQTISYKLLLHIVQIANHAHIQYLASYTITAKLQE